MKVLRNVVSGLVIGALLSHAQEDKSGVTKLELASLELPSAIRLRAEMAVLQRPEFVESARRSGLATIGMDYRADPANWASLYRAKDGLIFLTDDLNMALWVRTKGRWKCVVTNLRVEKTFGGAFPQLPVRYLGGGLFALTETVPGHVDEKSDDGFPQARAVTFLIDCFDGKVKERSESFVYDHNPPVKVPDSWVTRYKLKSRQGETGQSATATDGNSEEKEKPNNGLNPRSK